MNQQERIDLLKDIVKGIGKVMGDKTEVVLHDLEERKVVEITNSHVTDRSVGYKTNDSVYNTIVKLCDEDGHLVGYNSTTKKNAKLRSSHFLIKGEEGEPKALICINQDVTAMTILRDELDTLLSPLSLEAKGDGEPDVNSNIQKIATQLILEEIERVKPLSWDTKEAKIKILQSLHNRGIFSVKDAVPQVCELLSISQATLYVYLREIRSKETNEHGKKH